MQIERMKAAALRLGSQGLSTSFDDHLLIIGDAAGHIDPLTGEGIHTAIMVRRRLVVSMLGMVLGSGTPFGPFSRGAVQLLTAAVLVGLARVARHRRRRCWTCGSRATTAGSPRSSTSCAG